MCCNYAQLSIGNASCHWILFFLSDVPTFISWRHNSANAVVWHSWYYVTRQYATFGADAIFIRGSKNIQILIYFLQWSPKWGVANTIPIDLWQASISRPIYWLDCLQLALLCTINMNSWGRFVFYVCWTFAVLTDWHRWDHWCDWLRVYLLITTPFNLYSKKI